MDLQYEQTAWLFASINSTVQRLHQPVTTAGPFRAALNGVYKPGIYSPLDFILQTKTFLKELAHFAAAKASLLTLKTFLHDLAML